MKIKTVLLVAATVGFALPGVAMAQQVVGANGAVLDGMGAGGKVHDGESPEAALIRELNEELGIRVEADCLAPLTFASHMYDEFHLLMPLYICRKWDGFVEAREAQAALRP